MRRQTHQDLQATLRLVQSKLLAEMEKGRKQAHIIALLHTEVSKLRSGTAWSVVDHAS